MPILYNPKKKKGVFMVPSGGTKAVSCAFSYSASSYTDADPDPTPTVTGTSGGTFTSTAGIDINAATGTIDLSASAVNTYVITYTVLGKACTQSVEITASFSNTYSMEFDGVDSFERITTSAVVTGGDFTLSYWVNANGSYPYNVRFHPVNAKPSNNAAGQSIGYLKTQGVPLYPSFQGYDSTDTTYSTWTCRSLDLIGAGWRNIIWTFNNTNQNIYCYVDGVVQTWTDYSATTTTSFLIGRVGGGPLTFSDVTIGATWTPSEYFPGLVDEVSVFNSVLSGADIISIFGIGVPNDISSLSPVAWYRMGEEASWDGSDWTLTDQGSGGNDATSVNMEEADRSTDIPS